MKNITAWDLYFAQAMTTLLANDFSDAESDELYHRAAEMADRMIRISQEHTNAEFIAAGMDD